MILRVLRKFSVRKFKKGGWFRKLHSLHSTANCKISNPSLFHFFPLSTISQPSQHFDHNNSPILSDHPPIWLFFNFRYHHWLQPQLNDLYSPSIFPTPSIIFVAVCYRTMPKGQVIVDWKDLKNNERLLAAIAQSGASLDHGVIAEIFGKSSIAVAFPLPSPARIFKGAMYS